MKTYFGLGLIDELGKQNSQQTKARCNFAIQSPTLFYTNLLVGKIVPNDCATWDYSTYIHKLNSPQE